MINDEIIKKLYELQDIEYRDFQSALTPTENETEFIGVRLPLIRSYAKEIIKRDDINEFLEALPHKYFEENQLHAAVISEIKDFSECINELNRFLPYVDNWSTCDTLIPKVFKKHKTQLLGHIDIWLKSGETFTIRFGIKMLMSFYLDDDFKLTYPETVSKIRSEEYYVNMMTAWYFATALAKQYDSIIPFIENQTLDIWTHNKAIQKAIESRRITPEQKEYLRSLKIK